MSAPRARSESITEIALKLHAQPEAISAAVCSFASVKAAVDTAIGVIQSGIPVARVEFLDRVMMRGVNVYAALAYREAPTLLFEFHGSAAAVSEQAQAAQLISTDNGGVEFQWTTNPEQRTRLWTARDSTLYAAMALRPGSRALVTDVCVPISRLAECIVSTEEDIERSGLVAPIVGHVGDGNFHLLVLTDPNDLEALVSAMAFHARLVERAIALEGTCTGEHCIGSGKIQFLRQELGDAVDTMRTIKQANVARSRGSYPCWWSQVERR